MVVVKTLTPQRKAEIEFWRRVYTEQTHDEYLAIRRQDYDNYSVFLPEIHTESGRGLDLGCGLVSVLEWQRGTADIYAVDPLMAVYNAVCRPPGRVRYREADGEALPFTDAEFDFVWCINVIDHTPNPERMLSEARRVLKPGGRFYFMVNFDPDLYAPHYALWRMEPQAGIYGVLRMLHEFRLVRGIQFWSDTWKKYIWTALYTTP